MQKRGQVLPIISFIFVVAIAIIAINFSITGFAVSNLTDSNETNLTGSSNFNTTNFSQENPDFSTDFDNSYDYNSQITDSNTDNSRVVETGIMETVLENKNMLTWILVGFAAFLIIALIIVIFFSIAKKNSLREIQSDYNIPSEKVNAEAVSLLKEFIQKAKLSGMKEEEIISSLIQKGWKQIDIDEAFKMLS